MQLEDYLRQGAAFNEKTLSRFRRYYELLEETNKVMNLTAISGEADVATLHFLDCTALLEHYDFAGKSAVDVGTGAGFPGLPLRIACEDLKLTLMDSLDKRIGFLKTVCRELELSDVECIHCRAEEAAAEHREEYDIALSRAVARLNLLCELCLPMVKVGGVFIAMKSADCDEELKEAQNAIRLLGGSFEKRIDYTIPGTDITHTALMIRKKNETAKRYPRRWAQIKKQSL